MHVSIGRLLLTDRSGATLIEFALTLPIILALGLYGLEMCNFALASLQVNQIALNLADNASRVGSMQSDNSTQLREIDINDVLTATRLQGEKIGLTGRGRIVLSSLEETGGKQYIHWQRCLGLAKGAAFDSHYGTAPVDAATQSGPSYGGTEVNGMGDAGSIVIAPPGTGVMFVEVNYQYKPVLNGFWTMSQASQHLRYTASFIVRDRRSYGQIYNPAPTAQRYTCDKYTDA